ncbi:unnamed protein product, partial [Chrysoparadoxa australica]
MPGPPAGVEETKNGDAAATGAYLSDEEIRQRRPPWFNEYQNERQLQRRDEDEIKFYRQLQRIPDSEFTSLMKVTRLGMPLDAYGLAVGLRSVEEKKGRWRIISNMTFNYFL